MHRKLTRWLTTLLITLPLLAFAEEGELLDPEQAFQLSVSAADAETLIAEWKIAEGYYLYRKRFKFSTETGGITLGEIKFPAGDVEPDLDGKPVETYRGSVRIEIPVSHSQSGPVDLTLLTTSQGCADVGVCYTPVNESKLITLPAAAAPESSNTSSPFSSLKKLGQSFGLGGEESEFLPVDEAFAFSVDSPGNNQLLINWRVTEGYYLYRDKLHFSIKGASTATLGEVQLPAGKVKNDEFFGRMEIYQKNFTATAPVSWEGEPTEQLTLVIGFQGCAESGLCYPPEEREQSVTITASATTASAVTTSAPAADAPPLAEQDRIAQMLQSGSVWLILLAFFGFGLLLTFTPCVLPMVPILSSIIVGQGEDITTRRAFTLSIAYVIPMAITYAIAGVIAGMFGANLQAAFQDPWILGSFSLIFVALAFSMFGFYDLQMPSAIQNKLNAISHRQEGGTIIGVVIMGFLSALIVGPCVAAPLAGALIYIGQSGDALLGGAALFAMGLGMGVPLLAIGTSAGKLLPQAGGWMNNVKAVFGVMLLAIAVWMLERIVPTAVTMMLWAALLIGSAIYLGATEPLPFEASGMKKFWKGSGVVMMVYGVLLMVGAASGGQEVLQPLRGLSFTSGTAGAGAVAEAEHRFKQIKGIDELNAAIAEASSQNRPMMLDFYADWCISCRELERFTFSDPKVEQTLKTAVLLQADVTDNDATDKALLKHMSVPGLPSIHFFDRNGDELRPYRLVGVLGAEAFAEHASAAFKP
ncbi:thiol:disulfide interchange protein [Solemya pervernicosa gill symbiont]|uniref:Thiol:disulfide interchange protein DsbD n=2 Tax=Gammaproteobacteria incertae sedis TaxID=118884 RepID=A0A1T2L922_9GAMM|nr:protein-disulfide reductase DsbD [Candidatus Reidiella endopervernicosa]OOZ41570.1 thiol:disulfide interchange protein [Solemya pervernicosa gill symbiont]QKQ27976.1 protein-disulfide reductase DsbD [Candidatus Reidiella endopervernicosa]